MPCGLVGPSDDEEIMSGELKEIWDEEESSRASGREAPFQDSSDIVVDAMSSNNERLGFAGPIQD